eukprot:6468351-Amphidinium_carterae.1
MIPAYHVSFRAGKPSKADLEAAMQTLACREQHIVWGWSPLIASRRGLMVRSPDIHPVQNRAQRIVVLVLWKQQQIAQMRRKEVNSVEALLGSQIEPNAECSG